LEIFLLKNDQPTGAKSMPIIETERLVLRDFLLSDWNQLNSFLSNRSVTRFTHFDSWDETKRRSWLESLVKEASNLHRDRYNWAITLRSGGALIGWLIIGRSLHSSKQGMLDSGCGYALDKPYWGQGYMPEALRAAFTYAFTVLGAQRISADCETENLASARVMQKIGMQYEGTFYDADSEGNWASRHHYSIVREQSARDLKLI
jgi:[ribosomal protein S5]-alanine N-acetyltransferase